jgi:hypothetical protein
MVCSPLIFNFTYRPDISADFVISVFLEHSEHDRQLLGSMEINFHAMQEHEYGVKHPCDHYNQLTGFWSRDTADQS